MRSVGDRRRCTDFAGTSRKTSSAPSVRTFLEQRYSALRRRDGQRERALLASLMEARQQVPIVVVEGEGGRYVLVDGYKRVRALEKRHRDRVAAVVWCGQWRSRRRCCCWSG